MKKNEYFILFGNCIPVKGAKRSIICDLQFGQFKFIPNDLFTLIEELEKLPLEEVRSKFDGNDLITFDEYITFLINQKLGFMTATPNLFPRIKMEWDEPSVITNAILDVSDFSKYNIFSAFDQLDDLGCKDIQIRLFEDTNQDSIIKILNYIKSKKIKSVELVLKYSSNTSEHDIQVMLRQNAALQRVYFYSSLQDTFIPIGNTKSIIYTSKDITDESHCGLIQPAYFTVNIKLFTESVNFNSCLNRKVSIDRQGSIKNCPSMSKIYGNINYNLISSVIHKEEFTKIWSFKKDQISVCRDCEFRHICSDCRAFISDYDNIRSKPLKCLYDPYTATWKKQEESYET